MSSDQLRLISWNVAGKAWCLPDQVAALAARNPDIVALQEVRPSTAPRLVEALRDAGLPYALESATRARVHDRRYGVLLASRWPLTPLPEMDIPYQERALSAVAATPWGAVELHTAHIPPGEGNGWKKIETFEGIYARLAGASDRPRILCGDFNSPKHETADGRLITWGQRVLPDGRVILHRGETRWDQGERCVLEGLRAFDLPDVFRSVRGYGVDAWSWRFLGRGRKTGRRFDHVFASAALRPIACDYLHDLRRQGLSDHAPIEAVFAPGPYVPGGSDSTPADLPAVLPAITTPRPSLMNRHPLAPLRRRERRRRHEPMEEHPMTVKPFAHDIRSTAPDQDGHRQAQFRMGWRQAALGEQMQPEALARLTWRNLGYRLGALFGATSPELIDELYGWCVRQQAASQAAEEHE